MEVNRNEQGMAAALRASWAVLYVFIACMRYWLQVKWAMSYVVAHRGEMNAFSKFGAKQAREVGVHEGLSRFPAW